MPDGSSLGVTPGSGYQTHLNLVYNSVFPSKENASFIGGLSENQTDLNVLSQLTPQVKEDWYTFNFERGSNLKLSFNGIVGILGNSYGDPPGTEVEGDRVGLRYQLYDIVGNLLADSEGTPNQQTAYDNLTSSTGLSVANGGYYVKVSPKTDTTISVLQSYNFQMYSGTTYATSLVSTAQTQAYDPNLFVSAASTLSPAGNLNLYTNTASLSGDKSKALEAGVVRKDESEITVVSKITPQTPDAYYKFHFESGSALKFTLQNTTIPSFQQTPLRVQLYDSSGANLVADNYGTTAQKQAYAVMISGQGLAAKNGDYIAKISYAPGSNSAQPQSYNFQFNSGSTYATVYKTTADQPSAADTGKTPNLGIFTNSEAQLFTRKQFHSIGETGASAVNIGWLQKDKSRLDVLSQLTKANTSHFYNFTLQQGDNLKFAYQNSTNSAETRVQLFDASQTQVLADNYGTDEQKAAFKALTSTTGIKSSPGLYLVKVGYAPGASTSIAQTYNFQVYSGTTFLNSYRTTASSQNYENAILSNNPAVVGNSSTLAIARYLTNLSNGDDNPSIFDTLSTTV